MAWNHKSRVVALAVAIQAVAGVFTSPTSADIIPVAPPTNGEDLVSTDDPTATGSIWQAPRVYLGKTANVGATAPLRGPGGSAPPAANAWPLGRILQAAGYAEIRTAAAITGTAQAGGSTTSAQLAAAASATDDFYVGMPIQHADIGTGGTIKGNSAIIDYNGTSKVATLGETLGAAITGGSYTIPPNLLYQLGTLSASTPLLSVTVWRDKKRYDYRDVRITQLMFDMPVANEANQVYPSIEFQMKGLPAGVTDATAPALTAAQLSTIAPYRNGKFCLDKIALGHQSSKFSITAEVAGASNAAAVEGQDGYEIMSGQRTLEFDLNQMAVTDFDLETRVDNQTTISTMSLWGMGQGNRFVSTCPEIALDPMNNPGDRNGFVNLTGNAVMVGVDKAHTFAVWWD
jgi:hypothetical protein